MQIPKKHLVLSFAITIAVLTSIWLMYKKSNHQDDANGQIAESPSHSLNLSDEKKELKYPLDQSSADEPSIIQSPQRIRADGKSYTVSDLQYFTDLIDKIELSNNPQDRQRLVNDALADLENKSEQEAAAMLIAFLDSNKDAEIGMRFHVSIGGNLESHPTLRIAALDWLGRINPRAAKSYAREIFDVSLNPDEWALALRNYGRLTEPGTDEYFTEKIRRLVTNSEWQNNPTAGYGESHDAIVYNKQYNLVADLIERNEQRQGNDLFTLMVVDSLICNDRNSAFEYIHKNLRSFDESPNLRLNLMTRIDVRSERQQSILYEYLGDDQVTFQEHKDFMGRFPNYGGFRANRLLTTDHTFSINEQALIDYKILKCLKKWRSDTNLYHLNNEIENRYQLMIIRVNSARRAGILN